MTNTSAPLCPYCTRPVTGPHHVDADAQAWHLSRWERENPERDNQRDPGQYGLLKEGE
jgi:hypothetical protein